MLSSITEDKLAYLLKAIADNEKDIEYYRGRLADEPLFDAYSAFMRIDRTNLRKISMIDLKEFLMYSFNYFME